MKTQRPPQLESAADSDAYQGLLSNLTAALAPLQTLHQQAVETLAPTVREIIENRSRDPHSIEHIRRLNPAIPVKARDGVFNPLIYLSN